MQTKRKKMMNLSKLIDLTGKKFGMLTVLNRAEDYIFNSGRRERMWHCKCDCGNEINVFGENLKRGNTISCGCFKREKTKLTKTKHGLSDDRLYYIHGHMKSRCLNKNDKNYKDYGGRGIVICDEWLGENGFINFYNWSISNGYSDGLTIDRIEADGNYEPSNCRWVDMITQENNRTNNHLITYNNKTMTMAMWAKELGINYKTLANRICTYGWSVEKAFTTPVRNINKNERKESED